MDADSDCSSVKSWDFIDDSSASSTSEVGEDCKEWSIISPKLVSKDDVEWPENAMTKSVTSEEGEKTKEHPVVSTPVYSFPNKEENLSETFKRCNSIENNDNAKKFDFKSSLIGSNLNYKEDYDEADFKRDNAVVPAATGSSSCEDEDDLRLHYSFQRWCARRLDQNLPKEIEFYWPQRGTSSGLLAIEHHTSDRVSDIANVRTDSAENDSTVKEITFSQERDSPVERINAVVPFMQTPTNESYLFEKNAYGFMKFSILILFLSIILGLIANGGMFVKKVSPSQHFQADMFIRKLEETLNDLKQQVSLISEQNSKVFEMMKIIENITVNMSCLKSGENFNVQNSKLFKMLISDWNLEDGPSIAVKNVSKKLNRLISSRAKCFSNSWTKAKAFAHSWGKKFNQAARKTGKMKNKFSGRKLYSFGVV